MVNGSPFGLRPSFLQSGLNSAFSEYLGASCSDYTTVVVVQKRWYFSVTADLRLPRKPETIGQCRSIQEHEGLAW